MEPCASDGDDSGDSAPAAGRRYRSQYRRRDGRVQAPPSLEMHRLCDEADDDCAEGEGGADDDDMVVYKERTAAIVPAGGRTCRRRRNRGAGGNANGPAPRWRRRVNIEPVLLLSNMSFGLFASFLPIFMYYSRCTELLLDSVGIDEIDGLCSNLSALSAHSNETSVNGSSQYVIADGDREDVVQLDVANLIMYMRSFRSVPAILSCILLGAWSDKYGERRLPLIIAFVGPLVANFIVLLCTLVYKSHSVFGLLVAQETIAGFTGGGVAEFSLEMAMVTDQARALHAGDSSISLHVGIATGLSAFGMLLGQTATSAFSRWSPGRSASYERAALLCTATYAAAGLYLLAFVEETAPPVAVDVAAGGGGRRLDSAGAGGLLRRWGGAVRTLCRIGVERLGEVAHTLMRPRRGWLRFCIVTSVALVFIELLALDNGLLLLYVKRPPLAWSDVTFTYYGMFTGCARAAGQMFVWPYVASRAGRRFGAALDTGMVCTGLVFAIASYAMLSISTTDAMVFASGALQFFTGMMSQGFRSFLPKMVDRTETARIYTAVGIVVMVAPIPSSLIFNTIYKSTLHIWSGFAFFVVALMQTLVLAMMLTVHLLTAHGGGNGGGGLLHDKLVLRVDNECSLTHIVDNGGGSARDESNSSDDDGDL